LFVAGAKEALCGLYELLGRREQCTLSNIRMSPERQLNRWLVRFLFNENISGPLW
jgi:hypothetical protein